MKSSSSYATEIAEQDNEQSLSELEGRARLMKQLTREIHGEVDSQNKFLEGLGVEMDSARRVLAGTVERFTKVFESKSNRSLATVSVSCVAVVLVLYFFLKH